MSQIVSVSIEGEMRRVEPFAWRQGPGEGAKAFGEFLVWWGGWLWVKASECS